MDKITVSDLFFNSKEAEGITQVFNIPEVKSQADVFLSNYPALKEVFTAEELAKDFIARV